MNFLPPSPAIVAKTNRLNAANIVINQKIRALIEIFTPLMGTKIAAVSNYAKFTAKVDKLVSGITERNDHIHTQFQFSFHSVYLKITVKNPSVDYREWVSDEIFLGRIDSTGVLTDILTDKSLRITNFNAAEISENNQKIAELERQISDLQTKVPHLFRGKSNK